MREWAVPVNMRVNIIPVSVRVRVDWFLCESDRHRAFKADQVPGSQQNQHHADGELHR